ncbi:MAG: glycosyl transferase family 2 [Legionella sp.]|nr:MAG: glycosyl transferase family 2 [Legionella sp.]
MLTISFVVAVYRNAGTIIPTYEQIKHLFSDALTSFKYEVIFVDDGSDDNSLAEILQIRELDSNVKALSFARNFGQLAAITAGLKYATGDAVVNVSADLQDPIKLVSEMVSHWQKGSDLVVCHRTQRSDPFSARLFSRIAYGILKWSIPKLPAGGFDFVLMSRGVLKTLNEIEVRNRFFQADLLWASYRTTFIPYTRLARTIGKSQFGFLKKIKLFLDAFLDASYLPIRAISCLGLFTSAAGFIYAIAVAISRLLHDTPFVGYAPLMIVSLIVGGLNLTMLGIVGEYIWRIYDEVRKKPSYLIQSEYL